jgi:polyisoprenoid-binding protein YceI
MTEQPTNDLSVSDAPTPDLPASLLPTRRVDGVELPAAGRWDIDPAHTTVGFWVRHLGVTKVRGRFEAFRGDIVIGERPESSRVHVVIDAASIDTREAERDEHLRSGDFLDVEHHPTLTFTATEVRRRGRRWELAGDLTIRGVTRPVVLDTTFEGGAIDPWGGRRVMFNAATTIERADFGLSWNQVLETGGVLVGRKVTIELEVQLVRES